MQRRYNSKKPLVKKPLANHQIKAREVRLIDEKGKQAGIMNLSDALKFSRERGLDLIQVTQKVDPPICKLGEYGKFLYQQKKKDRKGRIKAKSELKGIRLTFNISTHDMEVRAKSAEKFLKQGNKVRLEMKLRGRQKALNDFAKEQIAKFLEILGNRVPYKVEKELRREPRGLTMIIAKE